MSTPPLCTGCGDPADPPSRRCLKCLVREWHQRTYGGNQVALGQDCRVSVYFTDYGLALTYRCNRVAAAVFAHEARHQPVIDRITIDDKVTPDMCRLPCEHLFAPA